MQSFNRTIWILITVFGFIGIGTNSMAQENRSYDGWLNNPNNFWGAAFTHVTYKSPVAYQDGIFLPSGSNRPNPRHISSMIFNQPTMKADANGLNALIWGWGQFIDHDITLSPDHPTEDLNISIPKGDLWFDPFGTGQSLIPMLRSDYDRTTGSSPNNPRTHINATTAYIDGSAVYGQNEDWAKWLRTFNQGKLKVSAGNLLPYNTMDGEYDSAVDPEAPEMAMPFGHVTKFFVAGDTRANENPLLTAIHALMVREHNRLCDEIIAKNPAWDDETVYQKARKIVSGIIQAIVYEEWLGQMGILIDDYQGYNSTVNPSIFNEFATAAYRYGHSTITPNLIRLDHNGNPHPEGDVALRNAFFNPDALSPDMGLSPYLMGAVTTPQQGMDCKVIDDLRNFLFGAPGSGGLDLVSLNINRGRDRGLMDFNSMRPYFGLPVYESFEQITTDPILLAGLKEVYKDIDKIDPWVGMLAEDHMPNAMFGSTAMAIIQEQFWALRVGDRYYYENDNYLTDEEKNEIKNTRFADLIRRNSSSELFPDNAFKVWSFSTSVNRTITGLDNNPYNPNWGATNANMVIATPLTFDDGISYPGGQDRPNPRKISNDIFAQEGPINDALNLSAYAWGWGQFIDHDITLSPDHQSEKMDISIPAFDAYFDPQGDGNKTMPMHRSDYVPGTGTNPANPRMYYNGITAFIDGSAVYGSDTARANWLRSFQDGKLKVSSGNLLPYNTLSGEANDAIDPGAPEMAMPFPQVREYFIAGDVRANENVFLTSIHTLFVREHNRLCEVYKSQNPEWKDEELYQYVRKIVGGQLEAIVYEEWLPTLGIQPTPYTGYKPDVNPGIMNIFATAAYRYGHSTIGSDFVIMDGEGNYMPGGENMQLRDVFFNPEMINTSQDAEAFLAGMSTVHTQEFDCHVVDDLRNFLFGPPGAGGLDLVSLNINRGRDRGLSDYNTVREWFGMPKVTSFAQLSTDPLLNQHFAFVYEELDRIDPWAGMLAEEHVDGSLFGRTAKTIIEDQFMKIRDGDRFYYENDPVLTPAEKAQIKATRLSHIIRMNTDITFIPDNIFKLEQQSTSTNNPDIALNCQIYPNPAAHELNIRIQDLEEPSSDGKFLIHDMTGRVVLTQEVEHISSDQVVKIDIRQLPAKGIYQLSFVSDRKIAGNHFIKI